jgi:hypothetical protein
VGRIVFNILISSTDDHLRNHGFLMRAATAGGYPRPMTSTQLNTQPCAERLDILPALKERGFLLRLRMGLISLR